MTQLSDEWDMMSLQYDEEAVGSYFCNGVARQGMLEAYAGAISDTNPCVMQLIGEVEMSDLLSILADESTCMGAIEEKNSGRKLQKTNITGSIIQVLRRGVKKVRK